MFFKIKRWLILLVSVSITFFVLWSLIKQISPTINPPKPSAQKIERDYRGTIKIEP